MFVHGLIPVLVPIDGACNPLVAEQSVDQIVSQLPETSAKFLTSSQQAKFPCDAIDRNIYFMGSTTKVLISDTSAPASKLMESSILLLTKKSMLL